MPVGRRWTTLSTPCGRSRCPQTVEHGWPQIHNRLTWRDEVSATALVDAIWTTSQSPGCGWKIFPRSVENTFPSPRIRTADIGGTGWGRRRAPRDSGPGAPSKASSSAVSAASVRTSEVSRFGRCTPRRGSSLVATRAATGGWLLASVVSGSPSLLIESCGTAAVLRTRQVGNRPGSPGARSAGAQQSLHHTCDSDHIRASCVLSNRSRKRPGGQMRLASVCPSGAPSDWSGWPPGRSYLLIESCG